MRCTLVFLGSSPRMNKKIKFERPAGREYPEVADVIRHSELELGCEKWSHSISGLGNQWRRINLDLPQGQ